MNEVFPNSVVAINLSHLAHILIRQLEVCQLSATENFYAQIDEFEYALTDFARLISDLPDMTVQFMTNEMSKVSMHIDWCSISSRIKVDFTSFDGVQIVFKNNSTQKQSYVSLKVKEEKVNVTGVIDPPCTIELLIQSFLHIGFICKSLLMESDFPLGRISLFTKKLSLDLDTKRRVNDLYSKFIRVQTSSINRYFYSGMQPCSGNCKYCFAKWKPEYNKPNSFSIDDINTIQENVIIYPTCESDFFDQPQSWVENILEQFLFEKKTIIISISTKTNVPFQKLLLIKDLISQGLRIKISISFTTKYSISEIEPNTTSYIERINTLTKISEYGIPTSINLKPLLPFISFNEYCEIIDDTFQYAQIYMIGDLYVNKKDAFFKQYIEGKYCTKLRPVNWVSGMPSWHVVEDKIKNAQIEEYIENKGGHCFISDAQVIANLFLSR